MQIYGGGSQNSLNLQVRIGVGADVEICGISIVAAIGLSWWNSLRYTLKVLSMGGMTNYAQMNRVPMQSPCTDSYIMF